MKKIVVASNNPVKRDAALKGFQMAFPDEKFEIENISVASGVRDQPRTEKEALAGALNRAHFSSRKMPDADFWIGMEGGVIDHNKTLITFAWIVIKSKTGKIGRAKTGAFFLPPKVAELVKQGMELGDADDAVFGKQNSKQKNGAVGLLTGNVITRSEFYAQAIVLALIPFKNQELYYKS